MAVAYFTNIKPVAKLARALLSLAGVRQMLLLPEF